MRHPCIKRSISVLLLCIILLLSGCAPQKEVSCTRTVFAMDTIMTLTATGKRAEEALTLAEEELLRLDALMNRHVQTSAVARLNREGMLEDKELASLLLRAVALSDRTGGAFDCTLAPLIDAWDIANGGRVPSSEEISTALSLTGSDTRISIRGDEIALAPGTVLDLGAIGKGYAGERVRSIYEDRSVTGSIALGGDNCLVGAKSKDSPYWRVGLREPGSSDGIIGILRITDTFTVTSGSYERFFTAEDGTVYHHILDPKTGCPARSGLVSVTVLAKDGLSADALATALFVMGESGARAFLAKEPDISAILITESGKVLYSAALKDVFSPENEAYTYEVF